LNNNDSWNKYDETHHIKYKLKKKVAILKIYGNLKKINIIVLFFWGNIDKLLELETEKFYFF